MNILINILQGAGVIFLIIPFIFVFIAGEIPEWDKEKFLISNLYLIVYPSIVLILTFFIGLILMGLAISYSF